MDNLDPGQRAAVAQLQSITDGNYDADTVVSILESVDWEIEKAANVLFGDQETSSFVRGSSTSSSTGSNDTNHIVSGSRRNPQSSPNITATISYYLRPSMLLSILTFPFHFLSGILRTIFLVLRLPFGPSTTRFSSLTFLRRPPKSTDPKAAADRWVRALEEETGATCVSRAGLLGAALEDLEAAAEDGKKVLPDFVVGSYEEALRKCEKEVRVGCVVLVSEEHDDVAEFKRATLTHPKLVHLMHSNNFVVWGGDVRDPDAWSASQKLQVTTFPFIAFLALQPRRTSSTSSSNRSDTPTLTVLSRHQGITPTSPSNLVKHLEDQLLPRVNPFLARTRQTRLRAERDRQLREEQDRAFQEAARRDSERLREKMEKEEREKEEMMRREEARERESVRREGVERVKRRMRTWARETVVPMDAKQREAVRIAVRSPSGGRLVLALDPRTSLTQLYAYVDAALLSPGSASEEGGNFGEKNVLEEIQMLGGHADKWWEFKLALTFPRRELEWMPDRCLAEIDGLKGGAQLVVEMCQKEGDTVNEKGEEEDGYETESDDET
ncbi:hypothetical protein NEOLEDRAFT_1092611 [Neolentinus lepideus HHB14362 ss-1]|uniref:UBX domain-containing protein n=1 Tax=Neolentinus lepideus HHB14362 ss-1 TaxID=1314782 RepID=A0A165SSE6_9AGAM|nr:hypothetical protein NEOLEDRAFT_1092611 [Neolentinus lepideus HHB14362 ss-1]